MKVIVLGLWMMLGMTMASNNQSTLPSFQWDKDQHSKPNNTEEHLWITFPDGGPDDVAILQHFNPILEPNATNVDDCIFHGALKNESEVRVALNGCPLSKSFQVSATSLRYPYQSTRVIHHS